MTEFRFFGELSQLWPSKASVFSVAYCNTFNTTALCFCFSYATFVSVSVSSCLLPHLCLSVWVFVCVCVSKHRVWEVSCLAVGEVA